ncbi:MAG: lipoate--protein ligase family protein [Verrucomicrobiota bacterium]|jgi:lipoate-protein ligase A
MLNVESSSWLRLNSGPGPAAFNMAFDEALLGAMPRLQRPALRFYGWTERAASFGYFQKYAEVERATRLRPLVRRPTGGGIVPHDADWTYSLAFPVAHEWYFLTAVESYRRVHKWIQKAFERLHVSSALASDCRRAGPGQCFVGHEKFDLLWRGGKIAGAAQRRTREGLLIQGSIQPPPIPLRRRDWEQAMCGVASDNGVEWAAYTPDAALSERVAALAAQKYSQEGYNQKQ